jgi:hypothetical protein
MRRKKEKLNKPITSHLICKLHSPLWDNWESIVKAKGNVLTINAFFAKYENFDRAGIP